MTTAQRPAKPSTHRASGGRDIFSRMLQMEKQSTVSEKSIIAGENHYSRPFVPFVYDCLSHVPLRFCLLNLHRASMLIKLFSNNDLYPKAPL